MGPARERGSVRAWECASAPPLPRSHAPTPLKEVSPMTQPSTAAPANFVEEVEIQGHIIDSLLLPKVLDEILTHGGSYVLKDIDIGQRQTDHSHVRIEVRAPTGDV